MKPGFFVTQSIYLFFFGSPSLKLAWKKTLIF